MTVTISAYLSNPVTFVDREVRIFIGARKPLQSWDRNSFREIGYIAYCHGIKCYDASKKCSLTSYLRNKMQRRLQEFVVSNISGSNEVHRVINRYVEKFEANIQVEKMGVVSIALLGFSVVSLFAHIESAVNAVFGAPLRRPHAVRLLTYAAVSARVQAEVGPEGDEPHYLMVAQSLLQDRDLALEQDYREGRYRAFHPRPLEPHYRVRGARGEIYSVHAVGLSVLVLPAYALGGYAGASFIMALLAVVVRPACRAGVQRFGTPSDRPDRLEGGPDGPCLTDQPGARGSLLRHHEEEVFSILLDLQVQPHVPEPDL